MIDTSSNHALRLSLLQIYQIIWLHAGSWEAGNSVKAFQHIIYVFTKGLSTCEHPLQSLYGIVTQLCLRSADLHSIHVYILYTTSLRNMNHSHFIEHKHKWRRNKSWKDCFRGFRNSPLLWIWIYKWRRHRNN